MSDLMLDVDQAGELKRAFRRGGWTNAEIKKLSEGTTLAEVLSIVRGTHEIKPIERVIDLSAAPFVPNYWEVVEHKPGDLFHWNPNKLFLYLDDSQKNGRAIGGSELRQKLKGYKVFNAVLLDWLLQPENQYLIPKEWKRKYVFFWGTVYRDAGGRLFVRYLYWRRSGWHWDYLRLSHDWDASRPALVQQD